MYPFRGVLALINRIDIMEQNIKRKTRILQVNLDGEGGAFALMYQMQGELLSD